MREDAKAPILEHADIRALLKPRDPASHKGKNGRGLLIAGSSGMRGAALMAAASALRGGIGTLKVFCPEAVCPLFERLPEAMVIGFAGGWDDMPAARLSALLAEADCVALGPGMGKEAGVRKALSMALAANKPTAVDADALNAMAGGPLVEALHENVLLTPHLGEMARLCGWCTDAIAASMEDCALRFSRAWGATLLLKSAQSVVAAPDGRCRRNATGNAGLAKGGSGDVLTGLCLAMLGQGLRPFEAACAASYLLGASADEALRLLGERFLMARDVIGMIEATLERF